MRSFARVLSLAAFAVSTFAGAQTPRRISTIDDAKRAPLAGNISPKIHSAEDLGEMPSGQRLEQLTLRFSLTPAQDAALTQLLQDQQNPASPRFHQWLTPETYAEQFGLAQADIDKVSTWLTSKGLTVTEVARSHTFITFSGSVGQIENAFQTSIHSLKTGTETHFSNISDPVLPASLQAVVTGITGMNDFRLKPHVQPRYTSSTSGNHYLAPGDIYTIYNLNPLISSSVNGSGVTIAVMGQTDISTASVATFRSVSGLPTNAPTVKLYGNDPGTVSGDFSEAMLDVEWSGAAAPNASILYVNSTDVVGTSLTQTINNNLAPIITISYGLCESGWGQANLNSYNALFRQANSQGQTIVGPTGDSGATDCDGSSTTVVTAASSGLAVDFPSTSPYVTALGGTMFNEGSTTGATTYWGATNGAYQGSALSYIPEAVWNEYSASNGIVGGGGGQSKFFAKPAWQVGTGVPNDFSRDVPDISLNAAAGHDGYLICLNSYCSNGYRAADGTLAVVGGTSVSTPIFAGILALIEQKTGSKIGNANPTLYALANSSYYSSVFNDVTTGNNAMPCVSGSTNCPAGTTSIGFSATTGYDLATGWGSLNVNNLVNNWTAVTPLSSGGASVSTTTLSVTPTSVTSGATVTATITVASATSGVTSTPSGTVQVLVDGTATGSAVTLASGVATATISTTSLSSGTHTISAAYSGDSVYSGSKGSQTINVTSASSADFSITPTTGTVTVSSGSAGSPLAFTLASLNGFAGSVSLTASTDSSTLAATYAFSVTPVTLTSGGTATTNFTLYAYQQNGVSTTGATRFGTPQAAMKSTMPLAAGAVLAIMLGCILPRRRRLAPLLAVMLAAGLFTMSGCGNNSSSSGSGNTLTKTTPGSYNITVTATSSSTSSTVTSHTALIKFVVN